MSDNGASAEGGPRGSFNEMYFFNFEPENMAENLARIDQLGGPEAYNHYPWGWAWAGNTPLKRWKRETHEGGVCDPLIAHWPRKLGRPGETRPQYVHAVDVMPTLLELIGIDRAGRDQRRAASAPSRESASPPPSGIRGDPGRHTTQYYEMLGSRALYHDGWKAVVFRPLPFVHYTEEDDPFRSFEDDDWELYHVAEDFSETRDLAAERPEKLAELVDLWWREAERYNVLPVTNMPIVGRRSPLPPGPLRLLSRASAPSPSWWLRTSATGPGRCGPSSSSPTAVPTVSSSATGAMPVATWSFVRHGRLHFTYNHLGTTLTTVAAEVVLPAGPVEARIEFTPTGAHAGDVDLFYGDVPVGQGHVPRTTLVTVGVHGFTVGYQRGSAINPEFAGRRPVTPGALRRVVIETLSEPQRTPPSEDRVGMASQ